MNRVGLGLAVGAGYLLGRTKKMKLAFAIGSLVAGKRMNLGPGALADLARQQLRDNPQFKEIGDQLRQDLRGVGKAASGAMVERQMGALADRLHGRTAQVRDQLAGVLPGEDSEDAEGSDEEPRGEADEDEEPRGEDEEAPEESDEDEEPEEPEESEEDEENESRSRQEERTRKPAAKKAPAKKSVAKKAPAKKAPAKKAAAKRTQGAARKTAAKKTAAAGSARPRRPKGGGER
ncbi:DNA primase [Streptomyces sp. NPDC006739]|uniref:DNA primase n=1 Tax=Streptomyces sp. NPDC006739 TaxID=3364763 RepID=UPI0036A026FB